jgi:uncharacterized protein
LQDQPEPLAARSASFTMHDIFAGPDGLRAGWGVLLFIVLWQLLHGALYPFVHSLLPPITPGTNGMDGLRALAMEATGLFCVVAATWVLARIEGRRPSEYGLRDSRRLRHFAAGAGWGAVILSALILCLWSAGVLVLDGRQLFGWIAIKYATLWLCVFLLVGLFEELLFRGYVQFTLARGIGSICARLRMREPARVGFWIAAILSSAYFGFGHGANPGESPIGLISASFVGLVFCFSIWRTGSLWWAIGFHVAWDWTQSFIYGAGDSGSMIQGHLLSSRPIGRPLLSGGVTGPEGSILVLPFIALSGLVVAFALHGCVAARSMIATERTEPVPPAGSVSLH